MQIIPGDLGDDFEGWIDPAISTLPVMNQLIAKVSSVPKCSSADRLEDGSWVGFSAAQQDRAQRLRGEIRLTLSHGLALLRRARLICIAVGAERAVRVELFPSAQL
jgi:hypothetical protein